MAIDGSGRARVRDGDEPCRCAVWTQVPGDGSGARVRWKTWWEERPSAAMTKRLFRITADC